MKHRTNFLLVTIVLFIAVFAAACPKRVSIGDIEADPAKYRDKTVAVAGTVEDSWGLSIPGTSISGGAYKISDGTGSIWIVTKRNVPSKGTKVGVKGRVGSGVSLGGRNYGLAIDEEERRFPGR